MNVLNGNLVEQFNGFWTEKPAKEKTKIFAIIFFILTTMVMMSLLFSVPIWKLSLVI